MNHSIGIQVRQRKLMLKQRNMIGKIKIPILKLHFLKVIGIKPYSKFSCQHWHKLFPYISSCPMVTVLGAICITLVLGKNYLVPVSLWNKIQPHLLVSHVPIPAIRVYQKIQNPHQKYPHLKSRTTTPSLSSSVYSYSKSCWNHLPVVKSVIGKKLTRRI